MLQGLGNSRGLYSVLKIVVEMKSSLLSIDRTAYTAMIDALLACGSIDGKLYSIFLVAQFCANIALNLQVVINISVSLRLTSDLAPPFILSFDFSNWHMFAVLQASLLFTLLYPSCPSCTTNPKYLKCWSFSQPVVFVLTFIIT